MPLDYEQHLSDGLKALFFDDARYSGLRAVIREKDLVFAVRKDEIHLYYLGGRILKITASYGRLRFAFDEKYAKRKPGSGEQADKTMLEALRNAPFDVDLWVSHLPDLMTCMERYRADIVHNEERQLQQDLELANRDFNGEVVIVDNEYGVREEHSSGSKLCKFDLVALYRDKETYKICLIELKYGRGALGGKAGIVDHIDDFNKILSCRKEDIVNSVNNLVGYKRDLGYLSHVPADFRLGNDTEICVSVLCYGLNEAGREYAQTMMKQGRAAIEGEGNVGFDLHFNGTLMRRDLVLTKRALLGE